MASGFLISCVPSEGKLPKKAKINDQGAMVRFLRNSWAAANFMRKYIDHKDQNPIVTVQIFDSNGYLERTLLNKEAVEEFITDV